MVGVKEIIDAAEKKELSMKGRIAVIMVTLVVIALLVGCAGTMSKVGVPGTGEAKGKSKKAVTKGKIEVMEVKMEKTDINNKDALSNLKVTGKAIYHQAKVGAKSFEDYISGHGIVIRFYDARGIKLPFKMDIGDYGKSENVRPNIAFPFEAETGSAYIGMDNFKKAVSCKAEVW
jgi:hypothetical protein